MTGSGAAMAGSRGSGPRVSRVVALTAAVVMIGSLLTGCDTSSSVLSGQVTAAANGSHLVGVPVGVFSNDTETQVAEVATNPFEDFEIRESDLPSGTYRVRVGDKWWPSVTTWDDAIPITLTAADPTVMNMTLFTKATLVGTVVDQGTPVAGVVVVANNESGAVASTALTDANGDFRLGLFEPGTVTVTLIHAVGPAIISVGGTTPTVFSLGVYEFLELGTIDLATGLAPKPLGLTDVTAISSGWGHSCALRANGTVVCWGAGNVGQLGNGTNVYSTNVPVEVSGLTDATAIAAGGGQSCAVRADRTVVCWGQNYSGELGNGENTNSNIPVEVSELNGQLGNETEFDLSSVPIQVHGLTDATAITTGGHTSCALRENGTVVCWGWNDYGQLGDGTETSSNFPVEVRDVAPVEVVPI